MPSSDTKDLLDKICTLTDDEIAEVARFVDSLRSMTEEMTEEQKAATAMTRLSQQAFNNVWGNTDDAEYDRL